MTLKTKVSSMTRPGERAWKENTTTFDRVRNVVLAVSEPRPAEYIAEEAAVSVETTRNHLDSLVDCLLVLGHNAGDQTLYSPDPLYTRFQTIRSLLNAHDRDGLIGIRDELQAKIDAWSDEYGVDYPESLRSHGDTTDSPQDTNHIHDTAKEWELVEHRLSIVTEAI
jgi:hypothetical protein